MYEYRGRLWEIGRICDDGREKGDEGRKSGRSSQGQAPYWKASPAAPSWVRLPRVQGRYSVVGRLCPLVLVLLSRYCRNGIEGPSMERVPGRRVSVLNSRRLVRSSQECCERGREEERTGG